MISGLMRMPAMLAIKHVVIACALLASATTAPAERLLSPYSWCGDCNLDICTDNVCSPLMSVATTKGDEDAMTAILRVFADRIGIRFLAPNLGANITLKLWTPTVGWILGTKLVLYRMPDTTCTYELADLSGDARHVFARINFNQLSTEYRSGGGGLVVNGVGKAVALNLNAGSLTWFSNYVSESPSTQNQTMRAFTYIFQNVCAPYRMPIN